jgi:hypothetical protein
LADFPFKVFGHLGTIMPGIGRDGGIVHEMNVPASTAWFGANGALYIPFKVEVPVTVTAIGVPVGATASGNIDVGIYTFDGVQLVSSGSTAQATAATLQTFNITDTQLGPGVFYFGIAMNNTTGTILRISPNTTRRAQEIGILQQGTAFPLPATATFATSTAGVHLVAALLISPRTAF